jgi:cyclophilin family peptidyl-prolyl cis-trans isomerase/HEAT repeat protein
LRRSLAALTVVLAGCQGRSTPAPPPVDLAAPAASSSAAAERVPVLLAAEGRRDAAAIVEADLSSPDPRVRRAAARALARIATDAARPGLVRLLSDEDGETSAFAAYGLAWTCAGHEDETVAALAARAASLEAPRGKSALSPAWALSRALGRCGTKDAEALLAAWLRGTKDRAAAAALGLGDVATKRKLSDETAVALTVAASGGLGEALAAFGRMEIPDATVAIRVREVATARLEVAGELRILAVRALGRTDAAAATPLARVLGDAGAFTVAERGEAARALGRLGERGQRALGEALGKLVPGRDPVSMSTLVSAAYGPLSATLATLTYPPPREARAVLADLAKLPVPGADAPASLARRVVSLRCGAARLIATGDPDPLLVACDPDATGQVGALARLAVLSRSPMEGPRRRGVLQQLATSPHAAVRSAAFEALASHREVDDAAALVVQGLASPHAGTVAAAAEVVARRPDLADSVRPARAPAPPDLGAAVLAALDKQRAPDDVETVAALVSAAGSLRVAAAKKRVEGFCTSPWPTLRAHAARALEQLGDKGAKCTQAAAAPLPNELGKPVARAKLSLDTDAGELVLEVDGTFAPMAATRLVDLAKSGFYDGMAVHRVVPGFVVQFGDRAGDGTGGSGRDPLRCETTPIAFAPLSIGVALSGRDTGSCQFFITLSRTPHLDGEYAQLGTASGDWAAVAEGDVIRAITVRE